MEAVCSFCLAKSGVISYDSFMKTTTLSTNSRHRPLGRSGLLSISLLIGCFGLLPRAQAVGPDTDGNIPGSNNGEGIGVLVSRTGGVWNTGTGFEALNHLTAGNQNTATGLRALNNDTNGGYNTATGVLSLFSNTSGFFNSATGAYSLANNTDGNNNTANGYAALYRNTADGNTATGFAALYHNIAGATNTAIGFVALQNNTGDNNTATGAGALNSNTSGADNTANGAQALVSNDGGHLNTAIGRQTLHDNTTGSDNIALGANAGFNLTTGDHNINIGDSGVAGESGTIRIGNNQHHFHAFINGIRGAIVPGGVAVIIDANGQLGTNVSSARFKDEIKPMDKASETILALKPVTFCYKKELDPNGIPQFGLVAEEVEKVNPDLVARDAKGEVHTVRYDAVNAMLLNEFLKEHRKVQEQNRKIEEQEATISQVKSAAAKQETSIAQQRHDFQATIAQQQNGMEAIAARLEEQGAQIQKVSAQVE